ncbi:MAG: GNAT family N-acetyltransferase [Bacteroidetes bacterium]|nr:GNAT family N-acetyltransferase [Bacteroidota bacterium]MBU1116716.1 GNAT family N-acetyltransferase [Bacteroidota bacterium]MBU1799832.1 GNAT family N-acetyltransferase [Bacteroidota bacterium]
MILKEITEFSQQLLLEINSLLSQLTEHKINFKESNLLSIINSENSILLGAFYGTKLIGILTLIIYQIPTAFCGRIEDVVVDTKFRGNGIGKMLSLEAIKRGKELNLDKIFLTSNPNRIVANQLYQKIGFQLGQTNSYFYTYKK